MAWEVLKELEELEGAREAGMAYMKGNTQCLGDETSSHVKKFVINIAHGFSRQNCRSPSTALGVPRTSLIEVEMSYYVSISLRKDDDIVGRRY